MTLSRAALDPALTPLALTALALADGVLARLWLEGPGDRCAVCPMADVCPDRRRCLHLVAGAGLTTRLDGPYARYPIGAGEVGRVPVTGRPFTAGSELPSLGVAEPAWLANHGIRSFLAVPLIHAGRTIGVLAVFSRTPLDPGRLAALEQLAALGAVALGHVRAFQDLALERNQIVARAARARRATTRDLAAAPARPDPLRPLAETQREAIARALEHTRGRVSGPRGAASILGMKPTTLFSRMKKLGVPRRPQ
jgi:hypothetical protein